ncbi:sodium-independent sulfate anion transporter-like [Trichogramma pretiosum]|uniref:sodium-independent sulfate anion transporter-like n=1 Tax=Trichogramma pretiosum TaxID=7493 RepID=UPI0006C9C365|nr:sodium-independent sulfate anion transporter-like [Trichogramma pretiosum]
MSKYDIKESYDVESGKDVRLTSYNKSPMDDYGKNFVNKNERNVAEKPDVVQPNGTALTNNIFSNSIEIGDYERSDDSALGNSSCCSWLDQKIQTTFRRKMLYKRIPIIQWLPHYRKEYIVSDMVAGFTVGLTVIPQAIAYANVAGLPLQYGLYSSFMACFVYTIFGSCKDVPVGPTAIAAIMTHETLEKSHLGPDFAVLLTFISGCVCMLMGTLQLGFLIDFISGPVSVGFTSAAAIIIATSQVKDILGISIKGGKFTQVWHQIFEQIGQTRLWDVVLGLTCMFILLIMRKVKDIPVVPKDEKKPAAWRITLEKFLWLMSTARNILVLVSCALGCWLLERHLGSSPVVLTGHVKQGLPGLGLPPFQGKVNNETYHFLDMVQLMGSGCIVVPLLSILETIAIAKAFSEGKPIDATQEMLAVGACNIVSSFFSSIPVSGGLSRGAVNHSSGVRTTLGGVYTGLLVLVSLQFLTPYLYYIPKASLAAVIIAAVVFMVEVQVVKPMWRTKKIDLIPAVVTFLCCLLLQLEIGIVVGIGINLLFLLYASARPSIRVGKDINVDGLEYLVITPDRSLVFPSVEYVRSMISKQGSKQGTDVPVVIDSTHIQAADFTAAKGIKSLIEDFERRGQPLLFYNLKPSIVTIFQGVKPVELRVCYSEEELNNYLMDFANNTNNTVTRH